jgi:thymidylate synthase
MTDQQDMPSTSEVALPSSNSFGLVYPNLCRLVMDGPVVEVRGKKTREIVGFNFVADPVYPLCTRPGFSARFALTETLQVICGRGDIRQLTELAPKFPLMAPSYVTYGPRAAWQLQFVYQMLWNDPTSRQAIVQIYQPEDLAKSYPDCPCTGSLQFLLREDQLGVLRLHLIVTMRSNDIWFGTPIDVFMFTFLQRQMAASLRVGLGQYVHQAGSFHAYEEHWDSIYGMLGENKDISQLPAMIPYPPYDWKVVREKAGKWLDGEIQGTTWVAGLDLG